MTWTLDNRHRLDGRSYSHRIGRPYYGARLRVVLAAPPVREPILSRVADYYGAHAWPAAALVAFGVIVAAATVAAWIAL